MKTQETKPKIGVTQVNRLNSIIFEDIDSGIDITFESFIKDLEDQGKTEDEIEAETQNYESDSRQVLIGQWTKDSNGMYIPDINGEFAGVFDSDSNIITIEWSKHTKLCAQTSPCYVMSDGSGPCGDLDSEGDSVLAFSLPPEYFESEG